ncbi:LacI family DNA-binding transcriptional regulator [Actinopolymorpha alba]|uniref:LacI family DNA-binding transcriptional regulator n=1 Tax=Actinopolymorpha alba TaxID=533267 RepID=UPI000381795F|nr:LacI family DNA-binding transcriptional regulator [Actinopolymorpha alba]
MKREVTIRDVAQAARVSPSTVSNLLNGRDGRMRPRTKARITRAIDELGYRPSRVARQLRTGQAQAFGLVVPSVANPFWGSFARAVESVAMRHGDQVLLCNSERDPERERAYVDELWAGGIRAVIIGTSLLSLDHLRPLMERGLRLVAFDRERQPADPPNLASVSVDNLLGGQLATEHLLAFGHRRIGFISGAIATVSRQRRLAGYRAALERAGVPFRDELVWAGEGNGYGDIDSAELGRQGMAALLDLPEPPSAVVTINDMYAIGACATARAAGLAIPGEHHGLSVVGFDDIVLAPLFNPPLTTVRQPLDDMARFAIEAIRRDTGDENEDEQPISAVMPPQLVARASTAAFATTLPANDHRSAH